jgi:hypothetical protein
MLTVAQLAPLKSKDPYLYETLAKIITAVNSTSQNAGVDPSTPNQAPSPIASVTVQAANGWFDLVIADPAPSRPGLFYFAESSTTPGFNSPRVYFLGSSRNLYVQLGNQTLYWRAYSQYVGSSPSAPVTYGSPAIAVTGGGASGPTPLPSGGSGTLANGTVTGGNGFGVPTGAKIVKTLVL